MIWRRRDDDGSSRKRWRRFLLWYVAPSAAAVVVALALGGPGAAAGVGILLGILGVIVAAWVFVVGLSKRIGAEIRLVDGQLICGKKSVSVDAIERWTSYRPKMQRHGTGVNAGIDGVVAFRVPDEDEGHRSVRPDGRPAFTHVSFIWAAMTGHEFDEIRAAIEPHVSAPWVPQEQLDD